MNAIFDSQNFCPRHFVSQIFKFLKIFDFLLCTQVLQHGGCLGDNSTPIVLLDNNENYAFMV